MLVKRIDGRCAATATPSSSTRQDSPEPQAQPQPQPAVPQLQSPSDAEPGSGTSNGAGAASVGLTSMSAADAAAAATRDGEASTAGGGAAADEDDAEWAHSSEGEEDDDEETLEAEEALARREGGRSGDAEVGAPLLDIIDLLLALSRHAALCAAAMPPTPCICCASHSWHAPRGMLLSVPLLCLLLLACICTRRAVVGSRWAIMSHIVQTATAAR
jgi:hypothetical protein